MKKINLLVLIFLLMVTGCGKKNQIKCTGMIIDSDSNANTEVVGYFDKNDKLYDVTVIYDFENALSSKYLCALLESVDSFKIDYVCKGTKVKINKFIDYNINLGGDDITGMSKMEFESSMEEILKGKISCKHEE